MDKWCYSKSMLRHSHPFCQPLVSESSCHWKLENKISRHDTLQTILLELQPSPPKVPPKMELWPQRALSPAYFCCFFPPFSFPPFQTRGSPTTIPSEPANASQQNGLATAPATHREVEPGFAWGRWCQHCVISWDKEDTSRRTSLFFLLIFFYLMFHSSI